MACAPETDIQVIACKWTLVDKWNTNRHVNGEDRACTWLIWQNQNGMRFSEMIDAADTIHFPIGLHTINRERR